MEFELFVQCTPVEISNDEILAVIGKERLAQIKETDPNPRFAVYAIGQEGISTPKILNDTSKPILWVKGAVSMLAKAVQAGTKLFFGHNKDNSTDNRESYGEVVATFEKVIQGKNTAITIAHVPSNKSDFVKKQDIVSMEAVIGVIEAGANYLASSVSKVSGLAIGSSDKWSPAMPGAGQLAMIQAMDVNVQANENPGETKMEFTFKDMETFKNERKVFASQLYKAHEIFGVPVKQGTKTIYQGGDRAFQMEADEYLQNHVAERTSELSAENEALKKQVEELSSKNKDYSKKISRTEFVPNIKKTAAEKKFTPEALAVLDILLEEADIPEDPKERETFQTSIIEKAEQRYAKHFAAGGGGSETDPKLKTPPGEEGGAGKNPFLIEE